MPEADKNKKWKEKLTPEEYHVMFQGGTERPFTGKYWNNHESGIYKCRACGLMLFSSDTKFDSGTGWPSFTEPANLENVELRDDRSLGMLRTEVLCKRCGAHLGHVFDDPSSPSAVDGHSGPQKRYCINSCSLDFKNDVKDEIRR